MTTCLKGWMTLYKEAPIVTHHLAKFNGHRPCGSGDIAYLIYHVTLKDHLIKGFCDFMEGSSSLYILTLLRLVAIDIVVVVDI